MTYYPLAGSPRRSCYRKIGISVEVNNADQAMAAVNGGADLIYCEIGLGHMSDSGQIEEFFKRVASICKPAVSKVICFPNLIFDHQLEFAYHFLRSLNPRIKESYEYLRLNNLGLFSAALSFKDLKVAIDYNMNIMNNLASNEVDVQNLKILTPSIEMSIYDLSGFNLPDGTELELFAHGPIKVGTSKVNIVRSLPEYVDSKTKRLVLIDEKGFSFSIEAGDGISELYNSVPLCILRNLPEIVKINPSFFRINAKHYAPEEGKVIVATYKKALNFLEEGDESGFRRFVSKAREVHPSFKCYTTGHYFRGVS